MIYYHSAAIESNRWMWYDFSIHNKRACWMAFDGAQLARNLPEQPGVYRMFDAQDALLYVGKAKNLRKRVGSYFQKTHIDPRIIAMVEQIQRIEVTVVPTESDALILESRLIKSENPKYNIALRDDRGYPYIHLSTDKDVPQLKVHFGQKGKTGRYYGPFPSSEAVYHAMDVLQKHSKLRTCSDHFFAHRSRPCLEHQIGRCSAPCVNKISPDDYAKSVKEVEHILEGKSDQLIKNMMGSMDQASKSLDFEKAAYWRDRIAAVRQIQTKVSVETQEGDRDVLGIASKNHVVCVANIHVRQGKVVGSKTYRLDPPWDMPELEVLEDFIMQYIQDPLRPLPPCIILAHECDHNVVNTAVQTLYPHLSVCCVAPDSTSKDAPFAKIAQSTAKAAVDTALASTQLQDLRMNDLVTLLNLPAIPQRVECYDISHTQGVETVASMVVAGPKGAIKSAYRRYNITGITPGDDYAAMNQVLTRRFSKPENLPDLLLIDGGIGQVAQAMEVLHALKLSMPVVGISKGPERKAGEETLILGNTGEEIVPGPRSPALHYLQTVRDEAHRFAIEGHLKKRDKRMIRSQLEDVEGIGPAKRQALLAYFGGFADIKKASENDLAKVPGIGPELAHKIFEQLKML